MLCCQLTMPFAPERIGPEARKKLERAFCVSVSVLTVAGIALPMAFAQAQANEIMNLLLLGIAKLLEWLLNTIGVLVLLLVDAIIGVAKYNDFVHAKPVEAGWPLIRDVVNMFFIVVLLITAFSTIIQYKKFEYRRILPKLLLMAVLVNFSRTLIGLLIDFSQVIMLTFVNGFQAAAAGNFTQALKLDKILALSTSDQFREATATQTDSLLLKVVMAEFLGMFILGTTLITLLIMLVYLIVRVVGLWMALIMSPAAFFATALAGTPLERGITFISGTFWKRLGALLSGGPIMAFFLWLTLATVQTGGFGDFTSQARQADQAQVQNVGYFVSLVGNTQEVATFLVGIIMLLMGVEAAVSISSEVSGTLGATTKKIRDYGMRATRFAAYGGVLAGGRYAARGARVGARAVGRAGAAGARYGFQRTGLETRVGEGLQRAGLALGVAGIAKAGSKLRTAPKKRREEAQKAFKEQSAGMSTTERIKTLEGMAAGGLMVSQAEKEAAIYDLAKEKTSPSGKAAMKDLYKDEAERRGFRGEDSKAFVEAKTRTEVAKSLKELETQAKKSGDDDVMKSVREQYEKDPSLIMDDEDLRKTMEATLAGGAFGAAGKIKSEALADSRVSDVVIGQMLDANGRLDVDNDYYKAFAKGDNARAKLVQQRLETLTDAAGGPQGDLRAVLETNRPPAELYMSDGKQVRTIHKDIIETARAAGPVPSTPQSRSPRVRRNQSAIKAGKQRLDNFRSGNAVPAQIRSVQYDMMASGANLPEAYKVDQAGRFENDAEREHYRENVQRAVREGAGGAATYRQVDLDYLKSNLSGDNQARTIFAATANTDQMKTAWQVQPNDSPDRKAVEEAVRVVHSEGARIEKLIHSHNNKNPQQLVSLDSVTQAGEANNATQLAQATSAMRTKISMDEAKALGQKRKIDQDSVLKNFRDQASTRAANAQNNANQPPPPLVPPTPPPTGTPTP